MPDPIKEELSKHTTKLGNIETKLGKLGNIDTKLGKLDGIDSRLGDHTGKLGGIDSKLGRLKFKTRVMKNYYCYS